MIDEEKEERILSVHEALLSIQSVLVFGMSVTIEEEGVEIKIGKERFQVDDSASIDTEKQVEEFFASASWLAGMRIVEGGDE